MTELTPGELEDLERRFENFDYDTAVTYKAGDPTTPPDVVLTQAAARAGYERRQAQAQ